MKHNISVEYLDDMWRSLIRMMYGFMCAKCRKQGHDAHHVIERSDKRHRWHPLNGVFLCAECHDEAHRKPKLFKKWVRRELPAVWKHINNPSKSGFDPDKREDIKKQLQSTGAMLKKGLERMKQTDLTRSGHSSLSFIPLITVAVLLILAILFFSLPTL